MNRRQLLTAFTAATATALLPACASVQGRRPALYDLGPVTAAPATTRLDGITVAVADVVSTDWLDSERIYYRLDYVDALQARTYSASRWAMAPAPLLAQRLRQAIVQAGGIALSATDPAAAVLQLRIQIDDFSQHFTAPEQSSARVSLRATLFKGGRVVAQRSFVEDAPASSADAQGGVQALAKASDAALASMIDWLGQVQKN